MVVTALGLLAAGGGYLWLTGSPRAVPDGQPPLASLDAASLQSFRDLFNAHRDEVRILAMLSPT